MKRKLLIVIAAALAAFMLLQTPAAAGYTQQKISDVVSYPLSTCPAPVLSGGDFRVDSVQLADDPSDPWAAVITSIYCEYTVTLVNSTESEDFWILYFNVPEGAHKGLYNLTLMQGGAEYVQPQSVWVLTEWPTEVTFSHITDIHEPITSEVFSEYVNQANLMNPDLVFTSGDNVQTENNQRAWSFLQYTLKQMEVPIYLIPGNHDYSGYAGRGYQQYGGRLNYTTIIGDFMFMALDSGENGCVKMEQLDWAEKQLALHPDKVKIIAFHHPLFSSEYEDDMGAVKGGPINMDWEDLEDYKDMLFFTYLKDDKPKNEAYRLLQVIQEQDVRVILNGHVHRDMIYILNGDHYFLVTSTTGGGLPPGSRYGSRLVTIDNTGEVQLDWYAEQRLMDPPNNLPTGYVSYWYGSENDFTESAVSATVSNQLEIPLTDAHIAFKVSGSHAAGDYTFVGAEPTWYEVTEAPWGWSSTRTSTCHRAQCLT